MSDPSFSATPLVCGVSFPCVQDTALLASMVVPNRHHHENAHRCAPPRCCQLGSTVGPHIQSTGRADVDGLQVLHPAGANPLSSKRRAIDPTSPDGLREPAATVAFTDRARTSRGYRLTPRARVGTFGRVAIMAFGQRAGRPRRTFPVFDAHPGCPEAKERF